MFTPINEPPAMNGKGFNPDEVFRIAREVVGAYFPEEKMAFAAAGRQWIAELAQGGDPTQETTRTAKFEMGESLFHAAASAHFLLSVFQTLYRAVHKPKPAAPELKAQVNPEIKTEALPEKSFQEELLYRLSQKIDEATAIKIVQQYYPELNQAFSEG
ncbi:MAG: hypothetical protein AAGN35_12815 [Bacteroidota bacterium]